MSTVRSSSEPSSLVWSILAAFALTILFVNPLRETAIDDDWGFALTVQRLLETGSYQLHEYSGMNMPFQVYWGAMFTYVFGYSHSSLRVSTLVLVCFGLIAFYYLAREHHLNHPQAGLLTLALWGSKLLLYHSFTFMTDVPFVMCLIIALYCYTRAIRVESYPWMLLASIAASAAILTRQFGLAIAAGVFFVWVWGSDRWGKSFFFMTGLILPALAGFWQVGAARTPNWTARLHMYNQGVYFANWGPLLGEILWRPTVILQYLALFTLPFVLLALTAWGVELKLSQRTDGSKGLKRSLLVLGLVALYILAGIIYGRFVHQLPWLLPYLDWDDTLASWDRLPRGLVTLLTSAGAVLYARMFILRYACGWTRLPRSERVVDLVGLFLFIQQLVFYKIGDRYFLVLLPVVLILLGRHLRGWLGRYRVAMAVALVVMLVGSSMWTRGLLEVAEATWKGAELVRATGVERTRIYGSAGWNRYYGGAFEEWLSQIGDPKLENQLDFWRRYLPERRERAQFLVLRDMPAQQQGEIVAVVPYRDGFFREKHIYVLRKMSGAPMAK
jgi:hypothetical protein